MTVKLAYPLNVILLYSVKCGYYNRPTQKTKTKPLCGMEARNFNFSDLKTAVPAVRYKDTANRFFKALVFLKHRGNTFYRLTLVKQSGGMPVL